MIHLSEGLTIRLDTFGTAICSTFSLIGSFIVIFSYLFVKNVTNKPRGARIIFNLAIADCIWFTSSLIQSIFWTFVGGYGEPGKVPVALCFILSPLVTISRMSSLMWTCIIAHEAVQSVYQRKWVTEAESSKYHDYKYFIFVYSISLPGGILAIAKQHSVNHGFGCEPDYEKLGEWYEIMFTELIPIVCGFLFNLFAFIQVRSKMSSRAFPRSVRKRRKRVMYHYVIVCIICWIPTIIFYSLEIFGFHSAFLEVFSRVCLYTTGFFNCLVFGMQDPHISRSFKRVFQLIGLGCLVGVSKDTNLKRNRVEKTVMFENAEKTNADIAKDKKTVYRYHRLSKEDKAELYRLRPDLNTKGRESLTSNDSYETTSSSNSSSYHEPLLLHHTMTQMERERAIQAQSKRDRIRELSDTMSVDTNDHTSPKNYRALKNIDGKMIRKPDLSETYNPYYDSDKDNLSNGESSASSSYLPPHEFIMTNENNNENNNHNHNHNHNHSIQVSPIHQKNYDIESTPDDKRINSLKRGTNLSTSSTPLQLNNSKYRFIDYDETNPYAVDEPYGLGSELDQEPIKSPTTIVSDESIFAPDCDIPSDDSSSDEDNDEDNNERNNSNQKNDDLVGNFLSWMF